mgnify:CR=1 FL=1
MAGCLNSPPVEVKVPKRLTFCLAFFARYEYIEDFHLLELKAEFGETELDEGED